MGDFGFGNDAERQSFIDVCSQFDIEVSFQQVCALEHYLQIMLEKNQYINLTAIRTWDAALVLHLLDSLLFLEDFDYVYPELREKPFLDMGTGAGLPGIPLAIMRSARKGVLCDSVKKKIAVVEEFVEELRLTAQLRTTTERLETLGVKQPWTFGCIVARAVASLPVLVEYATPLIKDGGSLIVSKGRPDEAEIESGMKVADICGFDIVNDRVVDLPGDFGQRRIIVFEKVAEPKIRLPRAVGVATKKPLA